MPEHRTDNPPPCRRPLKVPMVGKFADASDPVTAMARASDDAETKLLAYARQWCAGASCPGATRPPTLGDLTLVKVVPDMRRDLSAPEMEKYLYACEVKMTARISCACQL